MIIGYDTKLFNQDLHHNLGYGGLLGNMLIWIFPGLLVFVLPAVG